MTELYVYQWSGVSCQSWRPIQQFQLGGNQHCVRSNEMHFVEFRSQSKNRWKHCNSRWYKVRQLINDFQLGRIQGDQRIKNFIFEKKYNSKKNNNFWINLFCIQLWSYAVWCPVSIVMLSPFFVSGPWTPLQSIENTFRSSRSRYSVT